MSKEGAVSTEEGLTLTSQGRRKSLEDQNAQRTKSRVRAQCVFVLVSNPQEKHILKSGVSMFRRAKTSVNMQLVVTSRALFSWVLAFMWNHKTKANAVSKYTPSDQLPRGRLGKFPRP